MYNPVDNVDNFRKPLKIKAFAGVDKKCINPLVFHSKKNGSDGAYVYHSVVQIR